MKTDQWLILLGAVAAGAATIAAVTGIWLLVWGWFDRPHTGWNVRVEREPVRKARDDGREAVRQVELSERHKAYVSINPIGTAKAYDVQVWFTGCTVWKGLDDLYVPRMEAGYAPVMFEVSLPDAEDGSANVDVLWLQFRPKRYHGQRTDLRTFSAASWRWRWRSLRWRGRRLVRTRGAWVTPKRRPVPEVPAPEGGTGPIIKPLHGAEAN